MSRFDVDLVGNFTKGAEAAAGLRAATKKREAEDAYDSSRKAAAAEFDAGQKSQQEAAQAKENSRVAVNNLPGETVRDLLSLRDVSAKQEPTPAQKPSVFSEPEQRGGAAAFMQEAGKPTQALGLRDASLVNQSVEGKQPVLDGVSQIPPKAEPTAAPYAPAGLATVNKIATPEFDPHLMRVKQHELTAKYLREKGQYDLADAELDKATAAHDKYLTNTQAQRTRLAAAGARYLEAGNIAGATESFKQLTGMVHDGHEIHSLTQNKDGTFSVVYGADGNVKPVTVTKQQLVDLAKAFATPDINKHYEETLKMNKVQSEIAENNSTANLYNAKANGAVTPTKGTGGLTTPQRLKNFEIDKARELTAGLSPEEIKRKTSKFSATGRENPDFDPALESRLSMARKRKYGDDEFFDNQHPKSAPDDSPSERFSADPAMKDYKLGKQAPDGKHEVLDASGELVGYYE